MENRRGFVQGKLDIKMLILYILQRLPGPVDDNTLADLVLIDDGIVFFDYTECLTELQKAEHIEKQEDGWVITERGAFYGAEAEGSLPFVVRSRADKALAPVVERMRRNALLKAEWQPRESGGFDLFLSMAVEEGAMIELKLLVPTEEQAEKMAAKFRSDAEGIYSQLVESLLQS